MGRPAIHGELLKLGFELAESTVSKYMIRRRRPPSQSWRTFLRNHAGRSLRLTCAWFRACTSSACLPSSSSATTASAFVVCGDRHPTAEWLAQQIVEAFLRRDCLDHVLIFGARHLRRVLAAYVRYYNETRTHLSLDKDAPLGRAIHRHGAIVTVPILSGLHHCYVRI